jgi:hypothetical protein
LDVNTFSGAAIARYALVSWIEPHVRVGFDASRASAQLSQGFTSDLSAAGTLSGSDWSSGATVGAGFRVRTQPLLQVISGRGIAFAAAVEGGVHAGTPFDLALAPPAPSDEDVAADRIPVAGANLGELSRLYPYLRLSFALAF